MTDTPSGTGDPAALQAIRDRAAIVAKLGPPRPGGDLINAAHRSAADVPRLLKAINAVLALAAEHEVVPPHFLDDVTAARSSLAVQFREAITQALAREVPDHG